MAAKRPFSWGSFVTGAIAMIVLALIAGTVVVIGGLYPVAASKPDSAAFRWLAEQSRDRAIERSAAGLAAPKFSAADTREGAGHFKGMCQGCHGGPGVEPQEFASGMNPRPPDLAKAAGDLSVPQIFWIAKHGIKMTGMPAFGKTDEDEELWKVAAFVKALPRFSAAEYAAIPDGHEDEHEHARMAGDKHAHSN
jgi:mono/diheme cytochrome c family protein